MKPCLLVNLDPSIKKLAAKSTAAHYSSVVVSSSELKNLPKTQQLTKL